MTASPKQEHRALFLALQADAKSFPGGIRALAELMGLNATSLANALNPDHDSQPPAFGRVLEIIKLTQGKRGVFAIAQLVGQAPMDVAFEHRCRHESMRLFLSLIESAGKTLGQGSHAAQDGHFDLDERRALEPMLLGLIQATAELLTAIRQ